jgi:hypothetical protein
MLSVQLDIGWYRIGVHSEVGIVDPYGGASSIVVQYGTNVFPIEVDGVYTLPVDLGGPTIFGGLGLGLVLSDRDEA